MGSKPYPSSPSGLDLRANREELLRGFHANLDKSTDQATPAKQTVRRSRINNTKSGM